MKRPSTSTPPPASGWKQQIRQILRGFRHAGEGVMDAYRSQRHMRFHFWVILTAVLLSHLYRLEAAFICVLSVSIALVIITELINTVVESTINLIVHTYHPGAKYAKDVAAGAVLVAAINAAVVGAVIFLHPDRLARVLPRGMPEPAEDPLRDSITSLVLVMTLVVVLKVGQRRGSVLRGGWISGHSALAFSLAACIWFLSGSLLIAALALLIAALTAQTRVEAAIHNPAEVLLGGVLGIGITWFVFRLLP